MAPRPAASARRDGQRRRQHRRHDTFLFGGPFDGSSQSETIVEITFITGTTALVRLEGTLTGYAGLPPGLAEAEPGLVRTRLTWLVVKQQDEWRIQHQHMTAVQPGI